MARQEQLSKAFRECSGVQSCITRKLISGTVQEQLDSEIQNEIANWTFGLLITAILGAGTSLVGLVWIRASLIAARHANEINSLSISNAERAWVFPDVEPKGYVEYPEDSSVPILEIVTVNRNFGKTAAMNVRTNIGASSLDHIDSVMKSLVAENLSLTENGILIPPGDSRLREWVWSGDDRFELEMSDIAFIVGCVAYETMFDNEVHVTGFVYWLSVDDWGKPVLTPWAGSFAN
ncbi:hypothetical protein [Agrobacterium burrii]